MAKVGKFINVSNHTLSTAATTTYSTARRHPIPLNTNPNLPTQPRASALLSALFVRVGSIAGGCTSLTVRITNDAAGDNSIIGDVTATLSTGVTTATTGTISVQLGVDWVHPDDTLYLFWKTDAGTCTVNLINLTWEE